MNLHSGVGPEERAIDETNTAAVGSFTLEMGLLSRLTGDYLLASDIMQSSGHQRLLVQHCMDLKTFICTLRGLHEFQGLRPPGRFST